MPKQMIEIDIPEGFEFVEIRDVRKGDVYLPNYTQNYLIASNDHCNGYKYPILRKAERWRPATVADVQYPRKKARFRDFEKDEWAYGELIGVQSRPTKLVWQNSLKTDFVYWYCEVLCD